GYLFLNPNQENQVSTTQRVERFTGGATLTFRPWSFLTLRGTGGYDVSHQADDELTPANVVLLSAAQAQGNAFQFRAATFAYTGNFSATASYRPSEAVTTSTTAGLQFYKNVYQQVQASGRSVVAGTAGVSGVVFPTVHDTTAPAVTFGGFVEEAVAVHDRLYVTGALRDDHHSAFGTNFKSVLYPKLSASWVIGEEPFFPQLSWLSGLRLRAAWGESGRAPEPIDALQFSAPVAVALQGTDVPGITVGGSGNTNLRPEKTREFEGGFDADLIGQRLHFVATYYDKATTDALVAVPIAGSIGQSATRLANLGRVSNKGIELQLTAQVLNTPNLTWDVTVGAWGNRNRVLSTGPGNTPIIFGLGGASQRLQAGYPAGGYWDVPYTYKDLNGDGIIEPNEITIGTQNAFAGSSQPTQGATLSTDVGFLQHFRVHGLLDGRWGALLDNATEGFRCLLGNCAALALSSMPLADQAAAVARLVYGTEWGYYQDAGFVKLREVSVSYDAPAAWAARVGARTLSFTVSGRNLVTWTNYKGADPELNTTGQDNYRVADFLTQPPVRYFLARVNVTF
ncbi:MAG TPA: TonB-dependent receptor, partial [Gemmatimonadales bacterium]|nr:TonB-dependent receptor [Gemmatimonadales bacterium]